MSNEDFERPPVEAWLSLTEAGLLFDPPRNRRAMDQLVRREKLRAWTDDDRRVWTSEEAVRAYAASSRQHVTLRDPSREDNELRDRIEAMEQVMRDMSIKISELSLQLALSEQTVKRQSEVIGRLGAQGPLERAQRLKNPFLRTPIKLEDEA